MKKIMIIGIAIILMSLPQVFAETNNNPAPLELPPMYDWRNIDSVDYTTPH